MQPYRTENIFPKEASAALRRLGALQDLELANDLWQDIRHFQADERYPERQTFVPCLQPGVLDTMVLDFLQQHGHRHFASQSAVTCPSLMAYESQASDARYPLAVLASLLSRADLSDCWLASHLLGRC